MVDVSCLEIAESFSLFLSSKRGRMKLSFAGKLFALGVGSYGLGTLVQRIASKKGTAHRQTPKVIYTPQNVIGHLTSEQVDSIQAYADAHGIRWWNALEIFCQAWNEQRQLQQTTHSHAKG